MGSKRVRFSSCGTRALERRLSSCGARAYLLHGTWDLPGPGLEPVSPALAGGFLTTAPPGKPNWVVYKEQKFISHSSGEAGSLRSRCQQGWMRAFSQVASFSLCPHMPEGMRELCGASHDFITSQRPHLLNSITISIRVSTYELEWGHKYSDHSR